MKHRSKEQREADQLRDRIKAILAERDGWYGFEDQRHWLRKLSRREADQPFTENERQAVGRIAHMRTFFEGWDGYSAQELIREAKPSIANFGYDDEEQLNAIEHATRLTRSEMGWLVSLCRASGSTIRPFE